MSGRKFLALILLAASAAVVSASQPVSVDQSKALELLVRAFNRTSPLNIEAIMRMPMQGSTQFQTVQVQIARNGRQRLTVLQPIQRAGIIILDLGSTQQVYEPDKQLLTISDSPSANSIGRSERLRLVRKNYKLRLVQNISVAGTAATRIDATSRYPGFGSLSIYLDPTSYFVLRVDCVSPAGVRTKRFYTETVSYPEGLDPSTFELTGVTVTTTVHEDSPVPMENLTEARRRAGFTPVSPSNLPFGFVLRKAYVRSNSNYKSIGFNLSDGLTAATVFEVRASTCPPNVKAELTKHKNDFFQSGDTFVGIVSDLDPVIRARLLKAFRGGKKTSQLETENLFRTSLRCAKVYCIGTLGRCSGVATLGSRWRTQSPLG